MIPLEKVLDGGPVGRNFDKLALAVNHAVPQARAATNAGQSIPNNANTALTFAAEDFDHGDLHSTSSNTSRLTAPLAGLWVVGATAEYGNNGTGRRGLYLRVNGTTTIAGQLQAACTFAAVSVVSVYRLAASDYVEALAYQDSGGALSLNTNAWSSQLWMVRLAGYENVGLE